MKIYISGISPEVTERDLTELYSQFGKLVKVDLLKNTETDENRGYAFIEFEDEMTAESAILVTNNTLLGSQNIAVSMSRSRLDQKRAKQSRPQRRPNNNPVNSNTRPNINNQANQNNRGNLNSQNLQNRGSRPQYQRSSNSQTPHSTGNSNYPRQNRPIYKDNNVVVGNSQDNLENNDRYNTKDSYQNSLHKGVDYGRKNTYSPRMSFLGEENFASTQNKSDNYNSNSYNPNTNYTNYRNSGNINRSNRPQTNFRKPNPRPNYTNNNNSINPNQGINNQLEDNFNIKTPEDNKYNHI